MEYTRLRKRIGKPAETPDFWEVVGESLHLLRRRAQVPSVIGIDARSIFKPGGSAARTVLMGIAAFRRSTNMATGNLSSVTERYRREVNEYDARCASRPHDPAPSQNVEPTVSCMLPYH